MKSSTGRLKRPIGKALFRSEINPVARNFSRNISVASIDLKSILRDKARLEHNIGTFQSSKFSNPGLLESTERGLKILAKDEAAQRENISKQNGIFVKAFNKRRKGVKGAKRVLHADLRELFRLTKMPVLRKRVAQKLRALREEN